VEDHDPSEGLRCIDRGGGEGRLVDAFHNEGGVVTDDLGVAEILIGPIRITVRFVPLMK
jgi:hypothetical protein